MLAVKPRVLTILSSVFLWWWIVSGKLAVCALENVVGIGGVGSNSTLPGRGASIIGGSPAQFGQFRGYAHPGGRGLCGGQLVAPDIVVTAAHCGQVWAVGTSVFIGATRLDGSDAVETRFVAQILIHPDFLSVNRPNNFQLRNDVMLVKLSERSNEPTAQWNSDPDIPRAGGTVEIVGFGRTDGTADNSVSFNLLTTTVTAFGDTTCSFLYGSSFRSSQNFCYGSGAASTCQGDSGSPVFDTATGLIVGLVSFGTSTCSEASVGAELSAYAEWIRTSICGLTGETIDGCGPPVCGDGICNSDSEEDIDSCPEDCDPVTVEEDCGNGICQDSEDADSCIVDCGGEKCLVFSEGNLAANQDTFLQLFLAVPAGKYVACQTSAPSSNNNGDSDLHMLFEYQQFFDCSSVSPDANEVCQSSVAPFDARLTILIYGFTSFTDVTLRCYEGPCQASAPPPDDGDDGGGDDGGGGICFSELAQVDVLGQGPTRMDALKIGDAVRTADGTFSIVYSFGHKSLSIKTHYLQIFAANMEPGHSLEISSEHLIYTLNASKNAVKLVAAGDLQVGDSLLTKDGTPSEILWIGQVDRQGAYSPLTVSGNLLVNGVLASSYVSRDWLKDYVSGDTLHMFQHGAVLPVRLFCYVVKCEQESYNVSTGFSTWVQFWFTVEQWQLGLGTAAQNVFLFFFAMVAIPTILLGRLLALSSSSMVIHLLAACVGYSIWIKWNNVKVCVNESREKALGMEKQPGSKILG